MPDRAYTVEQIRRVTSPIVLSWPEFQAMFFEGHRQGEHVSVVGPTGSGKTLVCLELCKLIGKRPGKDRRPTRVVLLGTKPRDPTLAKMDWPIIKTWPPAYGQEHCIVWPRGFKPSEATRRQRAIFLPLLDTIYLEGGQTVYIGEAADFERPQPSGLGMSGTMEKFWADARSNSVTLISDTQRPRHVSRLMWSEPSWIIIFPLEDEEDLKRVASLSGQKIAVLNIVPRLGGHEFLCVRRQRDGRRELYVSRVDVRKGKR